MLTRIGSIVKDNGMFLPHDSLQFSMLVHKIWKEHHGLSEELASHASIARVEKNILYIHTTGGIWAQEIQLQKDAILSRLNRKLRSYSKETLENIVVLSKH